MVSPGEHSYAAGYSGSRSVRTWQERMKLLVQLGFIKGKQVGNQPFRYVLLVHPTVAVKRLLEDGKISGDWWDAYRSRQIDSSEDTYEKLMARHQPSKVVPIKSAKTKKKAS